MITYNGFYAAATKVLAVMTEEEIIHLFNESSEEKIFPMPELENTAAIFKMPYKEMLLAVQGNKNFCAHNKFYREAQDIDSMCSSDNLFDLTNFDEIIADAWWDENSLFKGLILEKCIKTSLKIDGELQEVLVTKEDLIYMAQNLEV